MHLKFHKTLLDEYMYLGVLKFQFSGIVAVLPTRYRTYKTLRDTVTRSFFAGISQHKSLPIFVPLANDSLVTFYNEITMALGKQAKVLRSQQIQLVLSFLATTRDPDRNRLIFLLSIRAGLRAKEIASLKWSMVMDADGAIAESIHLEDVASKGSSGREIPINKQLKSELQRTLENLLRKHSVVETRVLNVIRTQRSKSASAQGIVNLFAGWYRAIGLFGCSSHSGRRTFITNAARKISTVGGSIRDVQILAGHSSLQTTQRYIESDSEAKRRVVELV